MITVNKEEKRIDIVNEDFSEVILLIDSAEYKVPLVEGVGCLTNIQEAMNAVTAYGMTEIAVL